MLQEERIEREDAELELDVARSTLAAYAQMAADAINRVSYLRGKYDFEAAKLALERAELIVAREKALEEQLILICVTAHAGESAPDRSRDLVRAKAIEVALVALEFNRQFLASVLDLREGQVATRQDVILAELDVEREQKRLADAERRAVACRRELESPRTPSNGFSSASGQNGRTSECMIPSRMLAPRPPARPPAMAAGNSPSAAGAGWAKARSTPPVRTMRHDPCTAQAASRPTRGSPRPSCGACHARATPAARGSRLSRRRPRPRSAPTRRRRTFEAPVP